MCAKRFVGNKLERTYLQLRGIGKLFFLPPLVIYLAIPAITLSYWLNPLLQNETENIFLDLCHYLIPMLSTWWVFAVLREYAEGDGNELLYTFGKSKLSDVLILYIVYMIQLLPLFIAYYILSLSFLIYYKMLIVCFLYCSMCYFFVYATKSVAVSFIPLLGYSIYANSNAQYSFPRTSYCATVADRGTDIIVELAPFLVLGIVAFLVGYILNRYWLRFC